MNKIIAISFWSAVLVSSQLYLFSAIKRSQFAPHRITTVYCGKVLSEYYTTNPICVTAKTRQVVTTNGLQTVVYYETNQLWKIWAIFK